MTSLRCLVVRPLPTVGRKTNDRKKGHQHSSPTREKRWDQVGTDRFS